MRTIPTASSGSILGGLWFIFRIRGHAVAVRAAILHGGERVHVDGRLVSKRRRLTKVLGAHELRIDRVDYRIKLRWASLGRLECSVHRGARLVEGLIARREAGRFHFDPMPEARGDLAEPITPAFGPQSATHGQETLSEWTRGQWIGMWKGFAASFAFAAVVAGKDVREAIDAKRSTRWPVVQGQIVQSTVREDCSNCGVWCPQVRYYYEYEGKFYESGRIAFGGGGCGDDSTEIRAMIAPFSPRSMVSVRVNPWAPGEAVLLPGVYMPASNENVVAAILFLICGGVLTLGYCHGGRLTPPED